MCGGCGKEYPTCEMRPAFPCLVSGKKPSAYEASESEALDDGEFSAMNLRMLSSVLKWTDPPARNRATSSLLFAARFPKYVSPILVTARYASISRRIG